MSSNLNKYAAALFLAGLIGMTTGKVTDFLYGSGETHGATHEEARGFKIEVIESAEAADGAAAPAGAADISALFAAADVKAGGDIFAKKCAVCHSADKGGANKVGPALYGVVGRKSSTAAGFKYSAAMAAHTGNWTADELNHFLFAPNKWVKGTIMAFAGLPKDQDRANLIAFLNSKSDAPAKLGK